MYDITSQQSFERAKSWVSELQQSGSANMVIALAGNKADLSSQREVEEDIAQAYATENGLLFVETSVSFHAGIYCRLFTNDLCRPSLTSTLLRYSLVSPRNFLGLVLHLWMTIGSTLMKTRISGTSNATVKNFVL